MSKLDAQGHALASYIGELFDAAGDGEREFIDLKSRFHRDDPAHSKEAVAVVHGDDDVNTLGFMAFVVHGIKLALPTSHVKTVIAYPGSSAAEKDGIPQFFDNEGLAIPLTIIDSRSTFFPAGHPAHNDKRPYQYLVVLETATHALACDAVEQVFRIPADRVQWRSERLTRPWLAGMTIDPKCAVVDASVWSTDSRNDARAQH